MAIGSNPNRMFVEPGSPCPFHPLRAHGFSLRRVSNSPDSLVTVQSNETCCYLLINVAPSDSFKHFECGQHILHYHKNNPEGVSRVQRGEVVRFLVSVVRSEDSERYNYQ